jgi:hypothetical protein
MIRIRSLLREAVEWGDITIQDVDNLISSQRADRDSLSLLRTLHDFYRGDEDQKELVEGYLAMLNKIAKDVIALTTNIPFVDVKSIKVYLLSQHDFHSKEDEFFPFPIYVSASPNDDMTIGIMIDQHGKVLDIHEGNDEATPETINMVNKMVNPKGRPVRIYACHNTKLVGDIEISGYLPKDLYVSQDRHHAAGHMDLHGERSMFTGIIDINSVSQESDLDWKTLDKTKIEKFRWL